MIDLNLYGYRTPIKIKRSQSDNEERTATRRSDGVE